MKELTQSQAPDVFTRKWLLVVILCLIPPFVLFAYFGDPGRGRAAAICTAVIVTAVRAGWNLKGYAWFWVMLTIIVAMHVCLVFLVPWTSKSYPGPILLPFAIVDYVIVWGCIRLGKKVMNRVD